MAGQEPSFRRRTATRRFARAFSVFAVLALGATVVAGIFAWPWVLQRVESELAVILEEQIGGEVRLSGVRLVDGERAFLDQLSWRSDGGTYAADVRGIDLAFTLNVDREKPIQDWLVPRGLVFRTVELSGPEGLWSPERRAAPEGGDRLSSLFEEDLQSADPLARAVATSLRRFLRGSELSIGSELSSLLRTLASEVPGDLLLEADAVHLSPAPSDALSGPWRLGFEHGEGGVILRASSEPDDAGRVVLEAAANSEGLDRLRLQLARLPLDFVWTRLTPTPAGSEEEPDQEGGVRVAGGLLDLNLLVDPSSAEDLRWVASGAVRDLELEHRTVGRFPLDLDLTYTLVLSARPQEGVLEVSAGRFAVNGVPGALQANFADLYTEPFFSVEAGLQAAPVAALLGILPPEVRDADIGVLFEGDFDLSVSASGPLLDRPSWTGGLDTDFSRLRLVELLQEDPVASYMEVFPHEFRSADMVVRREVGPGPHYVELDHLPRSVWGAVVAREDGGFFQHQGFEASELNTAFGVFLEGGRARGASTITQQVAKNLFLSGERTLARKFQEALFAWRLERALGKRRILEIYLNIAEWGNGIFGLRGASRHYFGREPGTLAPEQAAFLATLLPSPRRYHDRYHPRGGPTRGLRSTIRGTLQNMRGQGFLTEPQLAAALERDVVFVRCNE